MNYEIKVAYTSIDEAQSIAVNYVAAFALNVRAISAKESRITECLNAIS